MAVGWLVVSPIFCMVCYTFKPHVKKKYFRTCAPSEDSEQTAHPRSLIRIFTGRILNSKDAKVLHTDNEDSDQTAGVHRQIRIHHEYMPI